MPIASNPAARLAGQSMVAQGEREEERASRARVKKSKARQILEGQKFAEDKAELAERQARLPGRQTSAPTRKSPPVEATLPPSVTMRFESGTSGDIPSTASGSLPPSPSDPRRSARSLGSPELGRERLALEIAEEIARAKDPELLALAKAYVSGPSEATREAMIDAYNNSGLAMKGVVGR